ncbi:MAG: CheR family methyltransferase [Geminicoccaceae bacterium]
MAIGASAGGLTALAHLFDALPADPPLAFVIVMHLHATAPSHLAEILVGHTQLPTMEVTEDTRIRQGRVYVIAANRSLTVRGGFLRVAARTESPGQHHPIDGLFASLAADQGRGVVAIILSGGGSDGSIGLAMVKQHGGIVLVQDPLTAEHATMPSQAIATDIVDAVLAPEAMPEALLRYAAYHGEFDRTDTEATDDADIVSILAMLHGRIGRDFTGYRPAMVRRRIGRRQRLRGIERIEDYTEIVRIELDELKALADDLTIAVTEFFRDPDAWEALDREVVGRLIDEAVPGCTLRVWVAGCATGEEAYSLGMMLLERREQAARPVEITIFATDIAEDALVIARAGRYPKLAVAGLTQARIERFFVPEAATMRVGKELRNLVVFASHDVLRDPPFSRLDLISCRNLLIYLDTPAQQKVLRQFHFALRAGGCLFLGCVESAGKLSGAFVDVSRRYRIYARIGAGHAWRIDPAAPRVVPRTAGEPSMIPPIAPSANLAAIVRDTLLGRFAPASVLIDETQTVLYYHGATDDFLVQPEGKPTADLLALARPGLVRPLRTAIRRAIESGRVTVMLGQVRQGAARLPVRVEAAPLTEGRSAGMLLVSFIAEAEPQPTLVDEAIADIQVENELNLLRTELRQTVDEASIKVEELFAANEEFVSINEELQSANEELESSKEETQSLNEELNIVNAQLQNKLDELERRTADLDSLLNGIRVATLFLDGESRIRWYTPEIVQLLNVTATDLGRSVGDITRKFVDDLFAAEIAAVQRTLLVAEREVSSDDGQWYIRRIVPYTVRGRSDGVVVTFIDITDRKRAEIGLAAHARANATYRAMIEALPDVIFAKDLEGRFLAANTPTATLMRASSALELIGKTDFDFYPPHVAQGFLENERAFYATGQTMVIEQVVQHAGDAPILLMSLKTPLVDEAGRTIGYVGHNRDVTEQRRGEDALREAHERLAHQAEELRHLAGKAEHASLVKSEFLAAMSHEIRTPLTGVLGMADLLATENLSPAQRRYLDTIRVSGRHLLGIINSILDFSRIEVGRMELERIDFVPADVLEQAQSILAPQAAERGLELRIERAMAELLVVRGDPTRLQQVLVNLVGNALKFTPQGSVTVRVHELPAAAGTLRLRFEVQDTGIGIPHERRPELFQPFVQADRSTTRNYGGSGLGLAICQRLVEAMDGVIGLESEVGQGSRFWFELPFEPGDAVAAAERSTQAPAPSRPLQVLVVDDVEANRELLGEMLSRQGHVVQLVQDGAAAVEAVAYAPPDVVLMDIQMPIMDGLEATRRIRRLQGPAATVPILALTANVMASERQRYLAAGMDQCLTKPVVWTELFAALASIASIDADDVPSPVIEVTTGRGASPVPLGLQRAPVIMPIIDEELIAGIARQLPPAVFQRLLSQGLEGAIRSCSQLRDAIGDPIQLQREAHRLRGTAGSFGLARVSAVAGAIEDRAGRAEMMDDLIAELEQAIADTRSCLAAIFQRE